MPTFRENLDGESFCIVLRHCGGKVLLIARDIDLKLLHKNFFAVSLRVDVIYNCGIDRGA